MSIATALTALADDVSAARAAVTAKGGTVTPDGGTSQLADDIGSIPSGGITPTGSVTLTEERSYDVTDKATAVVDFSSTRANLAEAVTAKGVDTLPTASFDTIATNIGLITGGGGGLPSVISKIDGGSFTLASDTKLNSYNISHNLGVAPKLFIVWCDDNGESGGSYPVQTCVGGYIIQSEIQYGTAHNYGFFNERYRKTNDYTTNINLELSSTQLGQALTTNYCAFAWRSVEYYKAGCTYKWLAWA